MSTASPFKYVFWGLVALAATLFGSVVLLVRPGFLVCGRSGVFPVFPFMSLLPPTVLVVLYVAIVATLVHRDASRRGMDPWLWATIAAFVPYLIGVIVYLVARSNARSVCSSCGKSMRSDYKVCPYCGHSGGQVCRACGRVVAGDWKVCAYCGQPLGE
jgi:RNA polymerase subunit RPABC4/transcription elongation factor Spt4